MKNKTLIITGGNKGIGLAISKKFIDNNWNVVIGGRTASLLKKKITSKKALFLDIDARYEKSHEYLVTQCKKKFGGFDAYINNVGHSEWKKISNINSNFLTELFTINLFSAFWGCKVSSKYIRKNGSIINISSIAGKRGSKNNSAYSASKFGMNGLTQSLSKELGNKGIRVNSICPVLVKTKGLINSLKLPDSPANKNIEKFLTNFKKTQSALNRLPTADEIANVALFLASDEASAITGQNINVDCGVFPQ